MPGLNGDKVDAVREAAPERLLRVEKVAERMDVSRTKVFNLIRTGELRSIKVGGSRRVPESAITDYIAEH